MKTGLFGGTFNPVHWGHLINAELVREELELDRVLFVPSRRPVHKELADEVSAEDRFAMLRLALEGRPGFEVSRAEIERETGSYTIETVEEMLRERPGDDLYLVIGADSYDEFHTWREYRRLLGLVTLVVIGRPGCGAPRPDLDALAKGVLVVQNPPIGISSSLIRQRVRDGLPVNFYLPEKVAEYIRVKGLYRN